MAVRLKVKEIAEKVGIKNASQLRTRTGLGVSTCYQLWDGSAQGIQLDTLNTLCNVLQVGPAMLFEYIPDVEPR
jgi:DNA-binding Xre family transcriptional regulator